MAAVIVHGGAGSIPVSMYEKATAGCREAAEKAYKILESGNSALDAVEVAVRNLEDNPLYNAGCGSVLNEVGEIEMDAMIADGRTLNYGAVAGLRDIANPVSLARMVMDHTSHVMLIGEGANQFAAEMGVQKVNSSELITTKAEKMLKRFDKYQEAVRGACSTMAVTQQDCEGDHDTVGAVAIDLDGNLAAASSTGGISLQKVGRVGDSPLIGAGAYCENSLGGVTCTGHGEAIAKVLLAHRVLTQLEGGSGVDLGDALERSLGYMWERVGGRGGVVGIDKHGRTAKHCTTPSMCWASVESDGVLRSGIASGSGGQT